MGESLASREGRSARPALPRRAFDAVRGVVWWFSSILGGQDYQRYVAHLRRTHPGCPIPTERQYWRDRHAEADRSPTNRCC